MDTYPRLIRRIQAILIDSILIPVAFFSLLYMIGLMHIENEYVKITALIMPIFILEPGMVAFTGGTIGHHLLKLRVKSSRSDKNLNIVLALIRFIVKTLFGWLSLIFFFTTRKYQTLHDLLSMSVVVNTSVDTLPTKDMLTERAASSTHYHYPSPWLRICFVLIYSVISLFIYFILFAALITDDCILFDACSSFQNTISEILPLTWLFSLAFIIIFGWQGKLFGCRRKQKTSDQADS